LIRDCPTDWCHPICASMLIALAIIIVTIKITLDN
jgi:hypothetical protein